MSTPAPAPKPRQYYKVVDTLHGHHGLYYQLGVNTDPYPIPLDRIRSCGPGAIYFTTAEHLSRWLDYGDAIAWVTPMSSIRRDEDGDKWKAHKIKITKMLPKEEAVFLIKGLDVYAYQNAGVKLTTSTVLKLPVSNKDKLAWLLDEQSPNEVIKFLIAHPSPANIKLVRDCVSFTPSEAKRLINAGLIDAINEDTLFDLTRSSSLKFIKELVIKSDRILKMLIDMI